MQTIEITQAIAAAIANASTPNDLFEIYAAIQPQLSLLERQITQDVLELQESVSHGGLSASYRSGAARVDYEAATLAHMEENEIDHSVLDRFMETKYNYKEIAAAVGIDTEPFIKYNKPSVSLKVK